MNLVLRFSASVIVLLALAAPASAQYMYLDSNGDGLNSPADGLPWEFSTPVDVWIVTNSNRDGSPATCSSGYGDLTLWSYEICLRAVNGSVTFGTFTNRQPSFSLSVGEQKNSSEYSIGYSGPTLPPGTYKLATIRVQPTDGFPSLEIVPQAESFPGARTGFASGCSGTGGDGFLLLGRDWFDAGGLRAGSIDYPPAFLNPPTEMVVPAGSVATQGFAASDPWTGATPITVESCPPYVTVDPGLSGTSVLRLRVAPGPGDVGTATVTLSTTDGTFTVTESFGITVTSPVAAAQLIDFESPPLGALESEVIDPYVDPVSGTEFRALPSGTMAGVVGLVKNSATSACVEPVDANQKLGTGPAGATVIGRSAFPIEVRFPAPLAPPVFIAVDLQSVAGAGAQLFLYDSAGNQVGAAREYALPADGTCGFPGFGSARVVLAAGSAQPVASVRLPGSSYVYVIDNFRFAQAPLTGPPVVSAPGLANGSEGSLLSMPVSASDPDNDPIRSLTADLTQLPLGNDAAFTPNPTNTAGLFTWTPAFNDAGTYAVKFTASNDGGSGMATTRLSVANVNRAPLAEAGGPYVGIVGIPLIFDGSRSSDPDGDPLTYGWTFGDGYVGVGQTPQHTYGSSGTFDVTLRVSDGSLTGQDSTTAALGGILEARAFLPHANQSIALGQGSAAACIQLEPVNGSYASTDVILSSIVMRSYLTGVANEILALTGKVVVAGDTDHNGVEEISVCFSRQDMALLFSYLKGRVTVPVRIEALHKSGAFIRADLDLTIVATGGPLAAAVRPNPMNPRAVLSFITTMPGEARVLLFDSSGRLVRSLLRDPALAPGYHEVEIDGSGSRGPALASGIYFYVIQTPEATARGRVAVLK